MSFEKFNCTKCSLEKNIEEKKKGKHDICKECHNRDSRERYKRQQEAILSSNIKSMNCSRCKKEKDIGDFAKNFRNCKECTIEVNKKQYTLNYEKNQEKKEIIKTMENIYCTGCKTEKKRTEFAENYIAYCRSCTTLHNKNRYLKNAETMKEKERQKTKVKQLIRYESIKDKKCTSCDTVKDLSQFSLTTGGYNSHCKECRKKEMVDYREKFKEEINNKRREEYKVKTRKVNSLLTKLRKNVLRLLTGVKSKTEKARSLLGIELKIFQDWIKYNCKLDNINYDDRTNTWHVDHVIPCKLFKINTEDDNEIEPCFHWTNMVPLESKLNIRKQYNIVTDQIETVKSRLLTFIEEQQLNTEEHMVYWNTKYKELISKVNPKHIIKSLNTGSQ